MNLTVFIDTEFTNFIDTELISIGMVAATGKEFYAEVDYPDLGCSAFVREAVIPLLGRVPGAQCSLEELYTRMTTWLKIVRPRGENVDICYDYQTDWDLFVYVLEDVPEWCLPRLVNRNINKLLRYDYYKKNNLPEHHALYDARANRYAFRESP